MHQINRSATSQHHNKMTSLEEAYGIATSAEPTTYALTVHELRDREARTILAESYPHISYDELRSYDFATYDNKGRYYHPPTKMSFIYDGARKTWTCGIDNVISNRMRGI